MIGTMGAHAGLNANIVIFNRLQGFFNNPRIRVELKRAQFNLYETSLVTIVEQAPVVDPAWYAANKAQLLLELKTLSATSDALDGIRLGMVAEMHLRRLQREIHWVKYHTGEVGSGLVDAVTGPVKMIIHPIQTVKNLWNVVAHPISAAQAIRSLAYDRPLYFITNMGVGFMVGRFIQSNVVRSLNGKVAATAGASEKANKIAATDALTSAAQLSKETADAAQLANAASQAAEAARKAADVLKTAEQGLATATQAQEVARAAELASKTAEAARLAQAASKAAQVARTASETFNSMYQGSSTAKYAVNTMSRLEARYAQTLSVAPSQAAGMLKLNAQAAQTALAAQEATRVLQATQQALATANQAEKIAGAAELARQTTEAAKLADAASRAAQLSQHANQVLQSTTDQALRTSRLAENVAAAGKAAQTAVVAEVKRIGAAAGNTVRVTQVTGQASRFTLLGSKAAAEETERAIFAGMSQEEIEFISYGIGARKALLGTNANSSAEEAELAGSIERRRVC